jgi:hypothetical protein
MLGNLTVSSASPSSQTTDSGADLAAIMVLARGWVLFYSICAAFLLSSELEACKMKCTLSSDLFNRTCST